MLKRLLAYNLLVIHLAFLILPELPFYLYFMGYGQTQEKTTNVLALSGDRPLTGDITFLLAIIERTQDIEKNAEEPILPERAAPNFVLYFNPLFSLSDFVLQFNKLEFVPFESKVLSLFLTIPSPPPKLY